MDQLLEGQVNNSKCNTGNARKVMAENMVSALYHGVVNFYEESTAIQNSSSTRTGPFGNGG